MSNKGTVRASDQPKSKATGTKGVVHAIHYHADRPGTAMVTVAHGSGDPGDPNGGMETSTIHVPSEHADTLRVGQKVGAHVTPYA